MKEEHSKSLSIALKEKEEACKEIYNEWSKKLVSNTYNLTQLEDDNQKYSNSITESDNEINDLEKIVAERSHFKSFKIKLKEDTLERNLSQLIQIKELLPNFKFTELHEGLKETIEWFEENYPNIKH